MHARLEMHLHGEVEKNGSVHGLNKIAHYSAWPFDRTFGLPTSVKVHNSIVCTPGGGLNTHPYSSIAMVVHINGSTLGVEEDTYGQD